MSKLLITAGNKKQAIKFVLVYHRNKVIMHRFHTVADLNALAVLLIWLHTIKYLFGVKSIKQILMSAPPRECMPM